MPCSQDYINIHAHFIGGYTAADNWPVVREAAQRGMGVFIISPSHQGGRLHHPSQKLSELTAPLSPAQFHILWLLSQPGVHTLSLGWYTRYGLIGQYTMPDIVIVYELRRCRDTGRA